MYAERGFYGQKVGIGVGKTVFGNVKTFDLFFNACPQTDGAFYDPENQYHAQYSIDTHRDNPEKAQYEVKDVFTFGNIENYSSAFAKTCAASKVPFRMFLFLALHSKIRNYAEFAAVIEDRHPSWIESFSTLTPGQIASIKCILEQKYKIELPFVQSADYVEFAPESAAEEEKIAAFMAMCKMYE